MWNFATLGDSIVEAPYFLLGPWQQSIGLPNFDRVDICISIMLRLNYDPAMTHVLVLSAKVRKNERLY